MREGLDFNATVTDRHIESVLIKGSRLQRQRACSAPRKTTKNIKKREKRLHCLLRCLQETQHQSEREKITERKRVEGKRKGERRG